MPNISAKQQAGFTRSCCRCGTEFRTDEGKRICSGCQKRALSKPLNPKLSFRELQVAHLVAAARLNKEIAYELHLTEATVKHYLNRIFRKVGMSNRTELAVWVIKQSPDQVGKRVA